MEVSILDCGVGNLFSLEAALRREGLGVKIAPGIDRETSTDALILPGVGSFGEASRAIPKESIVEWVKAERPLLGICLGLQLFFGSSEEAKGEGLAILPGEVKRLPGTVKVPHIGWNRLNVKQGDGLLEGVADGSYVYFVHSYYPDTRGPWVTSTTRYGLEFCATVERGSVWGMQFHPEKSGRAGSTMIRNFVRLLRR